MTYYSYLSDDYTILDLSKLGIEWLPHDLVEFLRLNPVVRIVILSENPILNLKWFELNLQLSMKSDIIIITN